MSDMFFFMGGGSKAALDVQTGYYGLTGGSATLEVRLVGGTGQYSMYVADATLAIKLIQTATILNTPSGLVLTGTTRLDSHFGTVTIDAFTDPLKFDLNVSNLHNVTLAGDSTISIINDNVGQIFWVMLKQGGFGSNTVTWFDGIKWSGGGAPTLTTTVGKTDVFSFVKIEEGSYLGFIVGQNA